MDNGDEIDATLMQVRASIYLTYAYSKLYNSKEVAFPAAQYVLVVDLFSLHRDTTLKISCQTLPLGI